MRSAMARGYQEQATAYNNIDGVLPDGRVRRNGAIISADDASRTQIDRARNQTLERQTGANPANQVGARAPVMADAVEPANAMGFTDPNRYRGNNRQLNVQRAKADGQFGSLQTKFNTLNQGKMSMDDQGVIVPSAPAAAPAPVATKQPQAEAAKGNSVPAAAPPYELTYQKANGRFYGETKAGQGQEFATLQEAQNFSRGGGTPPAATGMSAEAQAADHARFERPISSFTPAQQQVMQQPNGRSAGSGFGENPQSASTSVTTPAPAAPTNAHRYYDANSGTWKTSDLAIGQQPGLVRFLTPEVADARKAAGVPGYGLPSAPAPVITPAPPPSMSSAPTIYTGETGQMSPSAPSPVRAATAPVMQPPAPTIYTGEQGQMTPAATPQNSVRQSSPIQASNARQSNRPVSLSQLDTPAASTGGIEEFPRLSSSGSHRPRATLS